MNNSRKHNLKTIFTKSGSDITMCYLVYSLIRPTINATSCCIRQLISLFANHFSMFLKVVKANQKGKTKRNNCRLKYNHTGYF